MWSIALLTYPLTIVVAALTNLRKRGFLGFGNLLLTISVVIFCGSVGNVLGALGGAWQNQQPYEQTPSRFGAPAQLQYQSAQYQMSFASIAPPTTNSKTNERGLRLGLPKACLAFFSSYYQTYGFRTFLASVIVGMFAGTTANRFLNHVPQNRRTAAGLAKSILQSSERPS